MLPVPFPLAQKLSERTIGAYNPDLVPMFRLIIATLLLIYDSLSRLHQAQSPCRFVA